MSDRPMHAIPGAFQKLQAIYAEGEALVDAGRLAEAVVKFSEGLAIDDHFRQRYVTMYAQRGFAHHKLGNLELAISDYTKAIEMEPEINQAQYHFHRGMCHAGLDGSVAGAELAVADYTRAIALEADQPGPYHLRAKLLVNVLEKYEDAIPDLDRLLAMRPNAEGHSLRGWAHYMTKQMDRAQADFEAAHELAPDPYNDYMLAFIHAARRDEDAMYRCIEAALAGDPTYASSFLEDDEFAGHRAQPRFVELLARVAPPA